MFWEKMSERKYWCLRLRINFVLLIKHFLTLSTSGPDFTTTLSEYEAEDAVRARTLDEAKVFKDNISALKLICKYKVDNTKPCIRDSEEVIDYSCRIIGLKNTPATFEEAKEAYEFKIEKYDKKADKYPYAE